MASSESQNHAVVATAARVTAEINITMRVPATALEGRSLTTLISDVERAVNAVVYPSAESVILGWTRTALMTALARLRDRGNPGQAAVIEAALDRTDGKISRETALRLDGRDEAKSFRGFTKPVLRLVESMRSAGEVAPDAVDLLKATYVGAGTAAGFEVRPELADLL